MSNRDAIIILASVGTTVIRAKEVTYAQIQKELSVVSPHSLIFISREIWTKVGLQRKKPRN